VRPLSPNQFADPIEIRANWGDQAASVCSKLDLICINLHKIERYVVDSKSSMSSLEG
jgi:hypothetical protein